MVHWDDEPLMWDDPQGLVHIGGDLEPESLLGAYRRGIFPWFNEEDPYLWWSPDPRAIFPLESFHVSRRLARVMRQGRFALTVNKAFRQVMRACSLRMEGTWITTDMLAAYTALHTLGHAHSVEAWREGKLVGGVYGVAIGGFFAAESMFHFETYAGMVTLIHLVQRLKERGFVLFDTQMATEHTRNLGAIDIPRSEYLKGLKAALKVKARFD
jgi:leucyl/phenylalanyl-tRNA--protein transferase